MLSDREMNVSAAKDGRGVGKEGVFTVQADSGKL